MARVRNDWMASAPSRMGNNVQPVTTEVGQWRVKGIGIGTVSDANNGEFNFIHKSSDLFCCLGKTPDNER